MENMGILFATMWEKGHSVEMEADADGRGRGRVAGFSRQPSPGQPLSPKLRAVAEAADLARREERDAGVWGGLGGKPRQPDCDGDGGSDKGGCREDED
eukprot:gene17051-biopygen3833